MQVEDIITKEVSPTALTRNISPNRWWRESCISKVKA